MTFADAAPAQITGKGSSTIPRRCVSEFEAGQGSPRCDFALVGIHSKLAPRIAGAATVPSTEAGSDCCRPAGQPLPADFDPASLLAPWNLAWTPMC